MTTELDTYRPQLMSQSPTNGDNMISVIGDGAMQTRGAFSTAMRVVRTRSLAEVQKRLIEEADLAGESFYYGWGAGDNQIEGPSIDLAMAAVRCYGNCAVEMLPVQETADAYVFTAAFVDFETGFTLTRQFRQSKKWVVHGKFDEERKADIRFQIGQSKSQRNVVLKAMPAFLIDKAMEHAKDGVRKTLEAYIEQKGIAAAITTLLRGLAKHGVTEEQVLAKAAVAKKEALEIDALVVLRGDLAALDSGRDFASVLFPVASTDPGTSNAAKIASRMTATTPDTQPTDGVQDPLPPPPSTKSINPAVARERVRKAIRKWLTDNGHVHEPDDTACDEHATRLATKLGFGKSLDDVLTGAKVSTFVQVAESKATKWSDYLG